MVCDNNPESELDTLQWRHMRLLKTSTNLNKCVHQCWLAIEAPSNGIVSPKITEILSHHQQTAPWSCAIDHVNRQNRSHNNRHASDSRRRHTVHSVPLSQLVYAFYFDYKRRSDPHFRKQLRTCLLFPASPCSSLVLFVSLMCLWSVAADVSSTDGNCAAGNWLVD